MNIKECFCDSSQGCNRPNSHVCPSGSVRATYEAFLVLGMGTIDSIRFTAKLKGRKPLDIASTLGLSHEFIQHRAGL